MAKKVGLVLSGCGVFDGSEIHEAVLSLLALKRKGFDVQCLAPDIPQLHVYDHRRGKIAEGESRNVLTEAARIARGKIKNLADVSAADFDALFFPGGYGAAKNLCTFAVDGPAAKVNADVARLVRDCHEARKPMGFVCIAPAIAALLFGGSSVEVTIGNDKDTAAAIGKTGARHVDLPVQKAHVDRTHRIVTSPAYMYDATILEVEASINAAVDELAKMMS